MSREDPDFPLDYSGSFTHKIMRSMSQAAIDVIQVYWQISGRASMLRLQHGSDICRVLTWGLFRLPAYVANVMKVFTKFSSCNTHLLVRFYCLYVGEA